MVALQRDVLTHPPVLVPWSLFPDTDVLCGWIPVPRTSPLWVSAPSSATSSLYEWWTPSSLPSKPSSRLSGKTGQASGLSTFSFVKIAMIWYENCLPLDRHSCIQCEHSEENACFLFCDSLQEDAWSVIIYFTCVPLLARKEIKPINPKGNQPWIFIGRTGAEAETPILWLPDAKNWLIGKDPDAGKVWGQEEKGTTEDEMVGWHQWLNGHV